jgi:AP endonuclease-1
MDEFDREIGMGHLKALHLNDSKTPMGSKRDLHANIGMGFLGLRAFHNVMNEKRLEGLPMILETPIDRPVVEEENDGAAADKKTKKKPKTVEDKSIWAREIKLLESLIGMDVESEEFRELEKRLADEGEEEREKQMEIYERKKKEREDAEKKKAGKGKGKKAARKRSPSLSDSCCSG